MPDTAEATLLSIALAELTLRDSMQAAHDQDSGSLCALLCGHPELRRGDRGDIWHHVCIIRASYRAQSG